MGAKIDTSVNDQPTPYVFKISVANRLLPFTRGSKSSSLDENIVVDLLRMLDETNELAKLFRKARDKTQNIQSIDYKLRLLGKRNHDSRQYDDPTSNDIGALVVGDIGDFFSERDIIIESFSGHEKTRKRSRVPMRAYYAYLINERPGCDNTIIKGGRLYQQFLVDAFVNVEEDRLDYIRANQKDLRSEIYKGIHEVVLNGDVEGFSTGKIIVPSSLTAEIPDKLTDPKCYEIVSRFMMCRDLKDNFVIKNGIQLNNRYVVPYNRELLLRYNAHINIEICCQSMLIKYLFKYVSKGSDRCRVVVEKDRADEIHTYMNCRFICPYEAVWRLLQFPIHSRSPPVERLQIHLPLHQNVVYSGNESLPSILQKPEVLLNKFWRSMYDVIITRFKSSFAMPNLKLFDDELKNYVLYELELLFNFAGTSLEKQKLSMPDGRLLSEIKNKLLREELNYDTADLICQHSSAFPQLNQCQLNVYDCAVKSVLEKRQELIFVHGHGGTGKTFLWHTIINRLRSDGLIVLVVSSSGIASLLLPGGRTAHSRFKIPLTVSDTSSSLDRSLRDVLTNGNDLPNDKPFENMRLSSNGLSNDQKKELAIFANWILAIDDGTQHDVLFPDDYDASMIKIPQDLLLEPGSNPILAIVSAVYPSIRMKRIYLSTDTICKTSSDGDNADILYPVEFIYQLEFNGVPSHTISLRIGTPIMLLRNLNLSAGLCNKTRLIVTQLAERVIEAQIITGSFIGNRGGVIQAVAKTRDLPTFAATVIEGNHYEIKGFYTYENIAVNTIVAHDVVIDLKFNTKITGIEAITPSVPRYYFNFIDYAHIMTKSKSSRILTDVLGRLKALQPLEQVMVRGQTLENKREFMLENIHGEELRITLWGDSARDFDGLALHNLPSPVIIAFAGFRVTEFKGKPNLNSTAASLWYFNPDIPECLAYKHL
ncbi:uncharacterized protein [Populus alba]|uniref:uncharacterized protein n=1 Tax=Populus alba TaxID=43335 RepID=UPI003CC78FD5